MDITFLGQAGVLLALGADRLLIDPYLSDNLNALSNGFWARATPIPVDLRSLVGCTAIVCTHEHQDHLDAVTVASLLTASPETVFVAPEAALATLPWRADQSQLRAMRGQGETVSVGPFEIRSLPAAHSVDYQVERWGEGFRWCSVVVSGGGVSVFHSGDTVDYRDYAGLIGPVDVACVPINGRGREEQGIVGNLDAAEAADLCRRLPARHALAVHWDMFPVNPGDPAEFEAALAGSDVIVHAGPAPLTFTVDPRVPQLPNG